jgi:hypothetical protein
MTAHDAKHILCDGPGCRATAYLPVGLRAALAKIPGSGRAGVNGWLFVDKADTSLHFCPACSSAYLRDLKEAR